jgi:uncharacterized Ntn-hydrolase superfamily protein
VLVDLRVDDHPDPVSELRRLYGLHELLFGRTPPERLLPLEGDLADEVGRLLAGLGYPPDGDVAGALDRWAGVENLEERIVPGRIDPIVLRELRRRVESASTPQAP